MPPLIIWCRATSTRSGKMHAVWSFVGVRYGESQPPSSFVGTFSPTLSYWAAE